MFTRPWHCLTLYDVRFVTYHRNSVSLSGFAYFYYSTILFQTIISSLHVCRRIHNALNTAIPIFANHKKWTRASLPHSRPFLFNINMASLP